MLPFKKLQTKKLFYGRWPYKVETIIQGAASVNHLSRSQKDPRNYKVFNNVEHVALWDTLNQFRGEPNVKVRVEGHHANFFTDSLDIVNTICDQLSNLVVAVHSPGSAAELSAFSQNKRLVIVNDLPHKSFTHRVTLKRTTPWSVKETLKNWIEKIPEGSIKTTHGFDAFLSRPYFYSNPYFYIKEEKTASLIALMIGSNIYSIEKFVLSSSINTTS
jgi:hypothetical protein